MDVCDPKPDYKSNPSKVIFDFIFEGEKHTAHAYGSALDSLGGAMGLQKDRCLTVYSQHWELLHQIAAEKMASGAKVVEIKKHDLPDRG
ncbi:MULTISPECIES: hypothetical protein [unclassified Delftia]|uniref:hypothetical protein n=1 Tax=unclassified Delftia TaxID=2613839 RepID=UPI00190030E7|nr:MULTISPECIES: hypothetical protein [unclassified Delftia]MBK0115603.1 hypothetical protein [Delftia sp. S65]MBK0119540.1 hypothetical protein [Delftia sp. S67]MBK0130156.1 hypothetical protein [Delftia sp. S66]